MKAYGYQQNSDELMELEEVSFDFGINEIDEMISFLQYVKGEHKKVKLENQICHTHLRDWKADWNKESIDIIVVTNYRTDTIN